MLKKFLANMINIYKPEEIKLIRQSGRITAQALKQVLAQVKAGISTKELDKIAEKIIRDAGGEPSFMLEPGYKWTTCMNVNDMVVHGIPTDYKLQTGDRLGVDLGTVYKGFHSDASWTVEVGSNRLDKFLKTGEWAVKLSIAECVPGKHIGNISKVMEDTIRGGGYSPVKQLVGHGVGHKLHEDPEIPCYLRGKIENTALIKEGMVLAIEAIYNEGESQVVYLNNDGWTIVTKDQSVSGLFEHTVVVTKNGPEIVTKIE